MLAGEVRAAFERFAPATVETVFADGRPLILAPHPDDESIGCGGIIAACVAASIIPELVIVTDGAASHKGSRAYPPARLREVRATEVARACGELGLPGENLHFLGLPDAGAPWDPPVIETALARLESLLVDNGCGTVVASWGSDPHCDHEGTQALARLLARRRGVRLLSYPVWGWLLPPDTPVEEGAIQGWRIDITAHGEAKRRAVAAHRSQHGELITDAEQAFVLPADLLALLDRDHEILFTPR